MKVKELVKIAWAKMSIKGSFEFSVEGQFYELRSCGDGTPLLIQSKPIIGKASKELIDFVSKLPRKSIEDLYPYINALPIVMSLSIRCLYARNQTEFETVRELADAKGYQIIGDYRLSSVLPKRT